MDFTERGSIDAQFSGLPVALVTILGLTFPPGRWSFYGLVAACRQRENHLRSGSGIFRRNRVDICEDDSRPGRFPLILNSGLPVP